MNREELRQEFERACEIKWENSQGEPDIDYVMWLEDKITATQPSLPPAEGAEAFIRAKIADHKLHECYPTFIPELAQVMTEFAAQQQPTAEGAEEILDEIDLGEPLQTGEFYYRSEVLKAMTEYATLHAQRIAEKMVEERLREELMAYDKFLSNTYWGISHIIKRDEAVDEYLNGRNK